MRGNEHNQFRTRAHVVRVSQQDAYTWNPPQKWYPVSIQLLVFTNESTNGYGLVILYNDCRIHGRFSGDRSGDRGRGIRLRIADLLRNFQRKAAPGINLRSDPHQNTSGAE